MRYCTGLRRLKIPLQPGAERGDLAFRRALERHEVIALLGVQHCIQRAHQLAAGNQVIGQQTPADRGALALDRRLHQQRMAVELHLAPARLAGHAEADKPARPIELIGPPVIQRQQRLVKQLLHTPQRLASAQIGRAAHWKRIAAQQQRGMQPSPAPGAERDPRLDPFRYRVEYAIGGEHMYVDIGLQGAKLRQPRHKPERCNRKRHANGDRRRGLGAAHLCHRIGDMLESQRHRALQSQPLRRQVQPARQADEQRDAKLLLKRTHLLADRRLRHSQLARRQCEALLPRRGFEHQQP
jgi:hypothetical protein